MMPTLLEHSFVANRKSDSICTSPYEQGRQQYGDGDALHGLRQAKS